MANCSDSFPSTEVFYAEISSDIPVIVLLALACVLTIVIIGIFLEEHVYLQKVHDNDPIRQRRVITLLGLYPVVSLMALFSLLVPACTQLVDLIASCYLSVCIYMFVYLMVEYFGGDEKMVAALADDKIRMNTPPCCCCCVCLPRITLTRKHLRYIKILALQVAIVRPMLLFIAAVLWTDGKYVQGEADLEVFDSFRDIGQETAIEFGLIVMVVIFTPVYYVYFLIPTDPTYPTSLTGPRSAALYISILSGISTLLSMYGLIVIYRATRDHMKHQIISVKFIAVQVAVILSNIQTLVFGIMARYDVPPCIQSRGPKVRASNINHGVMIVEMFLLSILARYAYRRPEPDFDMEVVKGGTYTPKSNNDAVVNVASNTPNPVGTYSTYDNQTMALDENSVDIKTVS